MLSNTSTALADAGPSAWYAVQTRSRHEKIVRGHLERQHIEPFLPTITQVSQWKDRKKKVEFPLFAGYCFARLGPGEDRFRILQCPGVVRIVGSHERPEAVPDQEIESLRLLVTQSYPHAVHPYLKEGAVVEVVRGPLKGARGRLVRQARDCRLVLSVSLIQRAVAVEINAADVCAV